MDKHARIEGHEEPYLLENFPFFGELSISEISDTIERFDVDIQIGFSEGLVDTLTFSNCLTVYPLNFQETQDRYKLKGYMCFNSTGLMNVVVYTVFSVLESYDHDALYKCKNKRRFRPRVYYFNEATTIERYENLFLKSNVDYLLEIFDIERYRRACSHTFVVVE